MLPIVEKSGIVLELELRKMMRDQSDIVIRTITPILWLTIFGSVFSQIRQIPLAGVSYLAYITPGVLAQSVLFMSIFTGVSLVWERDFGQLDRLLSAPIPRTSIVLGKALAGGVKSLFQAGIILAIAFLLGVSIISNPAYMVAVIVLVVIFGICFSSLSILVTVLLKTRERVMGIVQLISMPLFFASNALYPVDLMPVWLQVVSFVNPMTYFVAALRALMITGNLSALPMDVLGIGVATAFFVAAASLAFRKLGV